MLHSDSGTCWSDCPGDLSSAPWPGLPSPQPAAPARACSPPCFVSLRSVSHIAISQHRVVLTYCLQGDLYALIPFVQQEICVCTAFQHTSKQQMLLLLDNFRCPVWLCCATDLSGCRALHNLIFTAFAGVTCLYCHCPHHMLIKLLLQPLASCTETEDQQGGVSTPSQ